MLQVLNAKHLKKSLPTLRLFVKYECDRSNQHTTASSLQSTTKSIQHHISETSEELIFALSLMIEDLHHGILA